MIHKLTKHIKILIQLGLKILIVFLGAICISGCDPFHGNKAYDYYYRIMIDNKTNETLIFLLNDSVLYDDIYGYKLLPNMKNSLEDGRKLNKGQDVIEALFSDGKHEYYSIASVFRNDSLLIKWEGPSFIKSDSIHHFFNYNSWESWLVDDNEGIVMFTIYEADLY